MVVVAAVLPLKPERLLIVEGELAFRSNEEAVVGVLGVGAEVHCCLRNVAKGMALLVAPTLICCPFGTYHCDEGLTQSLESLVRLASKRKRALLRLVTEKMPL